MGTKRKAEKSASGANSAPLKKTRITETKTPKSKYIFEPRPDWHAAELPPIDANEVLKLPPQQSLDALYNFASRLLEEENAAYNDAHKTGSSSHKFLSTIMSSGTLEDKVSALTLLVQESPMHATKAFENLIGLAKKKNRNQALMALAALKDLLGQGVVLPGDRKLRAFSKQPPLLGALQGKSAKWREGDSLPAGLQKAHLLVWAYEDWLKKAFFEIIQLLEQWCGDEVEYARSRALTYVFELLKDKPEQEENLLRLLVNKLGDTDRKIASRASYLLLQLETIHPAMKMIVTNSIEADCLFRPGQSLHARYYAIITLNQTIFSQKEEAVANRLLEIYFSLFVQLLRPLDEKKAKQSTNTKVQHGGGKAGKLAAKKRKAQERKEDADVQLGDRMIAQILTGVNRAFPYADTSDPTFEKQMDTLFRVTHSANFNTAVQALMLIQQVSASKHYSAERFYRTLYESLLDPRLISSSKQVMYLNLLYKSLKADLNAKRVQAFVKRLLQVMSMHEPPFICGVLYLVSELEGTFPNIRNMISEPEVADDDEEEHFRDVPDEGDAPDPPEQNTAMSGRHSYDPRKRNPEHSQADRSCLWDLLPFLQHFHPSVSLFAKAMLTQETMPPKPDPTQHTLMHFLDRFVYRSARTKSNASMHGSSIMQPTAGSEAADLLVKPGQSNAPGRVDVNSEAFWRRKVEDIAAEDVFFHQYFNSAGNKKRKGAEKKDRKEKKRDGDESGSDDEGEEEIWKAITASRPEVEGGADEDDDISMGDLESAYGDSDGEEDGSEGGIDLGGDDQADGDPLVLDDGSDAEAMDEMPDLDDEEDEAMFDDEDEVPEEFDDADEETDGKELSRNQQKRKERKKLKALPTFASAEDYARLLGRQDEDDQEDYM